MRVFIIGPNFINFLYSLERAFKHLGCDTESAGYSHPPKRVWMKRKLAKAGIGTSDSDHIHEYKRQFSQTTVERVKSYAPDVLVVLNGEFLDSDCLAELRNHSKKVVLYTLDAIYRFPGIGKIVDIADKVICMDEGDISQLKKARPSLNVSSHQFGYDSAIFYPDNSIEKDIDISFIGAPTSNRKEILSKVACYAKDNKLNLVVNGAGYWDERYWWKRRTFKKRWHPLEEYCSNRNVTAEQAADIYRRSKICLNIHIQDHDIINNRCFEIPACGSLMVCDACDHVLEMFNNEQEAVFFKDVDELFSILDRYLMDKRKRDKTASDGRKFVSDNCTVQKLAESILEGM